MCVYVYVCVYVSVSVYVCMSVFCMCVCVYVYCPKCPSPNVLPVVIICLLFVTQLKGRL